MLLWIIQTAIISFVFIYLIHYLVTFFKSTLTVPKIKDLVNTPTQKYEAMYNIINKNNINNNSHNSYNEHVNHKETDDNNSYTLIDLLPNKEPPNNMKNELKSFLKTQLHNHNNNIETYNDLNNENMTYSSY